MKFLSTLLTFLGIVSTSVCEHYSDSYPEFESSSLDFESFDFEFGSFDFEFGSYSFEFGSYSFDLESPDVFSPYEDTDSPIQHLMFTFSPTPSGYSTEGPTAGPSSAPTSAPTSLLTSSSGIDSDARGLDNFEGVNSAKSIVPFVYTLAPVVVLVGLFC